jgi:Na+-driven multidrug efflux pump
MLVFGAASAGVLLVGGWPLSQAMVPDRGVQVVLFAYFAVVPVSYAFQGLFILSASLMNVSRRPLLSFMFSAVRLHAITLPSIYLASRAFGINGFFVALAICNVATGIAIVVLVRRRLYDQRTEPSPVTPAHALNR